MSARELLALLAVSTVWGFHIVVIKSAVGAVPPIFYAAMRMSLVAVILAAFLRWRPGQMVKLLAAGLCLGGLNYAFMFTGIKQATASSSAIALELYAPFATILSVLFLKEKVGWRRTLGIALAFAGVAIIALGRDGGAGASVGLGVGLVAFAALTEATGAILVTRTQGLKPHELLAWYALFGSLSLWAATAILETNQLEALQASKLFLVGGAVVYSAVLASIFAHTLYYWLLQRLPVSQVAPSALLTTLLAITFSIVFLGDRLTWLFAVGGAMALTGVGIILLRTAKARIIEPGAPEPIVGPVVVSSTASPNDERARPEQA
ncbi:MAG: DMT family transporter [Parvularculaceae bacterium]